MRLVHSILGAFVGLILPVIFFSYNTAPVFLYFLHIPVTSGIFAFLVLKDTSDVFKPLYIKYKEDGKEKKKFNPFYGWLLMSAIINVVFSIIHISER